MEEPNNIRTEEEQFNHARATNISDFILHETVQELNSTPHGEKHGQITDIVERRFLKYHPEAKLPHVQLRAFTVHSGENVEFHEKFKYSDKPLDKTSMVIVHIVVRFFTSLSIVYKTFRFTRNQTAIVEVKQSRNGLTALKDAMVVGANYTDIGLSVYEAKITMDTGNMRFRDTVMIPLVSATDTCSGRGKQPLKDKATRPGFTLKEGMTFFACFGFIKLTPDKKHKLYGIIYGETVVIKKHGPAEKFQSIPFSGDTPAGYPYNVNVARNCVSEIPTTSVTSGHTQQKYLSPVNPASSKNKARPTPKVTLVDEEKKGDTNAIVASTNGTKPITPQSSDLHKKVKSRLNITSAGKKIKAISGTVGKADTTVDFEGKETSDGTDDVLASPVSSLELDYTENSCFVTPRTFRNSLRLSDIFPRSGKQVSLTIAKKVKF